MNNQKRVLGLTVWVGGVKSMVLSLLKERCGAIILECDEIGRGLQQPGGSCYQAIVDLFGREILSDSGALNRGLIAQKVFRDGKLLERLNGIMHPAVKGAVRSAIDKAPAGAFIVVEAALLLEDHYDAICDEIWFIYADEPVRRERLKSSRGYDDERIDRMMAAQKPESFYRSNCRAVIDNSSDDREKTWMQVAMTLQEHGLWHPDR